MKKYLEYYSLRGMVYPRIPYTTRVVYYYICDFFATWTTHLIEVFTRKDFGIRHFNLGVSLRLALLLSVVPIFPLLLMPAMPEVEIPKAAQEFLGDADELPATPPIDLVPYIAWYIFVACFVAMSLRHWLAQRKRPLIFDEPRHTRYAGTPHKWFFKIKLPWLKPGDEIPELDKVFEEAEHQDARQLYLIECWYEPALFMMPGIVLFLIGQNLGLLMVATAILYSGHSHSSYWIGRQAVYNTYDQLIEHSWDEHFLEIQEGEREKMARKPFGRAPIKENNFRRELQANMSIVPTHRAKALTH